MEWSDLGWLSVFLIAIIFCIIAIILGTRYNHQAEPFKDDAGKFACSMKGLTYDISVENKGGYLAVCHILNPYRFDIVRYNKTKQNI